jgi:hypothetical protein
MVATLAGGSAAVNVRSNNAPVDADQSDSRSTLPQSRHELTERPQPQAKQA